VGRRASTCGFFWAEPLLTRLISHASPRGGQLLASGRRCNVAPCHCNDFHSFFPHDPTLQGVIRSTWGYVYIHVQGLQGGRWHSSTPAGCHGCTANDPAHPFHAVHCMLLNAAVRDRRTSSINFRFLQTSRWWCLGSVKARSRGLPTSELGGRSPVPWESSLTIGVVAPGRGRSSLP